MLATEGGSFRCSYCAILESARCGTKRHVTSSLIASLLCLSTAVGLLSSAGDASQTTAGSDATVHCGTGCESSSKTYRSDNDADNEAPTDDIVSSVRCLPTSERRHRQCVFHNLCFWPRHMKFVYSHGPESVSTGLPKDRFSEGFLDASSIDGHNTMFFEFTDIPRHALRDHPVVVETGEHVIFRRFKPDNIMHVLHDDLLPLYHTLQRWDSRTVCSKHPKLHDSDAEATSQGEVYRKSVHCASGKVETTDDVGACYCEASQTAGDEKIGVAEDKLVRTSSVPQEKSYAKLNIEKDSSKPLNTHAGGMHSVGESKTIEECRWPRLVYIDDQSEGRWIDWLRSLAPVRPVLSMGELIKRGKIMRTYLCCHAMSWRASRVHNT